MATDPTFDPHVVSADTPHNLDAPTAVRSIWVESADGQTLYLQYETNVKKDTDKALFKEIKGRLVPSPIYVLPLLADGSNCTFYAEVTNAGFAEPAQPEEP